MAHAADIDRGYLGKLEHGKYSASLDTLEKIANAMELDPTELLRRRF